MSKPEIETRHKIKMAQFEIPEGKLILKYNQ